MDPFYHISVNCMLCGREFKTSKVRPSFRKAVKSDSDFCTYFKEGSENPDYYVVRVCPHCGYASTENFKEQLNNSQVSMFQVKIGDHWIKRDLGSRRSTDDAMFAYKLALLCSQIAGESMRVTAGLLHHIAWLYRYKGNAGGEERFLRYAMEAYIKVYEIEGADLNNARLMYVIGELHRRLKEYQAAVMWFGRVIHDKKITDAGMIRACREGWALTRENMLAERLELPDELKSAGS